MNITAKANGIRGFFSSLWSMASILVCVSLVGLFVYWALLQRPVLHVSGERVQKEYVVTAGSLVYVENPVAPAEYTGRIEYTNALVSRDGTQRYVLPSPDVARQELRTDAAKKIVPSEVTTTPLYAVFVPSYVQPGDYTYRVTAQYRLNPFRTATLELPPMTIKVE